MIPAVVASPSLRPLARLLPAGLGVLLILGGLYRVEPGQDFHYIYWPTVRWWALDGAPLYGGATSGFFNLPWTAFFLLPFALLPERLGRAALAAFSFAVVFIATAAFAPQGKLRLLALALVLPSFHTLYIAVSGQIDAFPLLGLVAGWWAIQTMRQGHASPLDPLSQGERGNPPFPPREGGEGVRTFVAATGSLGRLVPWVLSLSLVLLSIKPQAFLAVIALYLWSWRWLPWKERLAVLSLPVLTLLVSFPVFGLEWPSHWWQAYHAHPPFSPTVVTTWHAAEEAGLPPWAPALAVAVALAGAVAAYLRLGLTKDVVSLALLTGAVATPYSSPSTSFPVLTVAFPTLLAAKPLLAFLLYPLSLTPLLRLGHSFSVAWIDIAFWWGLWLATWAVLWAKGSTDRREHMKQRNPEASPA